MRSGPLTVVVLLAVLASSHGYVAAQPPPRARVELAVPEEDRAALSESLRELGAETGVLVEIDRLPGFDLRAILGTPAPAQDGLLARAWLRVAPPEALLVLSDATGGRLLLRRVEVGESIDAVEVESLAQIVASSLEALRLGGEIGVTRSEVAHSVRSTSPPPPAQPDPVQRRRPSPPSPGPRPGRYSGDVEVAEQTSLWSTKERPQHRVALRGLLSLRHPWRPALVFEASYLLPATVSRGDVGARLEGLALRAGFGLRRTLGRLSVRARVTAGLDLLHVEPRLLNPSALEVRPPLWTTLGALEIGFGLGYRVLPRVSLFVDFGVAVFPDARYVVERADRTETTFDPFRARPFASVGLRVSPAGTR